MRHAAIGCVLLFAAGMAMADDISWTGGAAPNRNWSTAGNWSGTLGNPTADRAVFDDADVSDSITKIVDGNWEVGGLRAIQNGGTHLLNLQGNMLTIGSNGDLHVQRQSSGAATLTIANGTLAVTHDIYSLTGSYLRFTNNATLSGPFDLVQVGYGGNNGYMDLRGATVAGGVFEANTLQLGGGGGGSRGELWLGPGSLNTLRIHDKLYLDSRDTTGNQRGGARIGAPDPTRGNRWYLPYGINIYVGSPSVRGRLHVHYVTSMWGGSDYSRLASSGGGDFEAWLTDLVVSDTVGTTDAGSEGWLDLRGMDSFLLDAEEARIGVVSGAGTVRSRGYAYFPAGTARVERLYIGDDVNGGSIALLGLSNTYCRISQRLDMKESADISVDVSGSSSGLDMFNAVDTAFSPGAKITVTFRQAPDPGSDPHWGIRWAGDHAAVLGGLVQSGTIDLLVSAFTGSENHKTGVYYDTARGYTYAALVDATTNLPPALTAKDITVEAAGSGTIRIAPGDLILSEYNPDSLAETGRKLSYAGYMGGAEVDYIDFATTVLPITHGDVTVKVYYTGGVSAEDTADVVLVPLAAGTTADVTWEGMARDYTYLDRREWKWGANWVGGQPPTNPTAGTVTFADYDNDASVVKLLPPVSAVGGAPTNVWTVGSLRVSNLSGGHALDLGYQTLETTGDFRVERAIASGASSLAVSNGIITVGGNLTVNNATLAVRDVDIAMTASGNVTANAGTLTLTSGTTLSGTVGTFSVGTGGTGVMDMRGASLVDGLLEMDVLRIGGGNAYGAFYVGPETLRTIRVHDDLWLNSTGGGGNQRGHALIGAPDPARGNQWFLPPDVSIYIGSAEARASLEICAVYASTYGYDAEPSRLAVSGGGDFEAWLDRLIVADTDWTHGGNVARGTLDLRGMDSFAMDVEEVRIALDVGDNGVNGQVYLPAGTATMGDVTIGSGINLGTSTAVFELNDTVVTVTNSLTLRAPAAVTINVAGRRGSGLLLPGLPTVGDGATVHLVFEENPSHTGPHFGLKVEGSVVAELKAAPWLSWDESAMTTRPVSIFEHLGDTYVGVPPPAGGLLLVW